MNNEQIEAKEGLTFRRAWFHMLNGKKVKRPSWKGYWCFENGTIMIYTMEGDIIDIRDTKNVAYTFSNIVENDWMVVEEKQEDGRLTLEAFIDKIQKLAEAATMIPMPGDEVSE